jgi:hypothetical protein
LCEFEGLAHLGKPIRPELGQAQLIESYKSILVQIMLGRAIFRENLADGGRGFPNALKKGRGHTIALTRVTFDASRNHIGRFICTAFADRDEMIDCVGFLSAIMTSEVIAL